MKPKEIYITLFFIVVVSTVHYLIPEDLLYLHIILRFLYLIPIAYIALGHGRKAGTVAAAVVTLIFTPHFFMATTTKDFFAENIGAILLFFITGFFIGNVRNVSEKEIIKHNEKEQLVKNSKGESKSILFYIDHTRLSASSVEWFVSLFGVSSVNITLMCVYSENQNEKFPSLSLAGEHISQLKDVVALCLEGIRKKLINKGIASDRIVIKTVPIKEKVPVSDMILEELNGGQYDLAILAKHEMTKAQEFIFGDTAVQLLRKSSFPVLSVKGST